MSKIRAELEKATGLSIKTKEDKGDYMVRLAGGVSDLDDKKWNAVSAEAQNWYNQLLDAVETKAELPAFPDEVEEAPPETSRRRGRAAAEEPAADEAAVDDIAVGDKVVAVTKRGKEFTGEVLEIDDAVVIVKTDDGEEELTRSRLESLKKVEAPGRRGRAAPADEPEAPADPKVGDVVEVVTSRDKAYKGKVLEIDDEMLVLDVDGKDQELPRNRLKSVKVCTPPPARRGAAGGDKKEEAGPRATPKANGGVSVTQRIRELVCEDLDASLDDITKSLKSEKLEFRDNTVAMTYADAHKVITILKGLKKLK